MSIRDVRTVLGDRSSTWAMRRARLQGWTGADAEQAAAAAFAQRLGPAACAAGAFAGAALRSPAVLGLFAATAVAGAAAANHPFEWLYNRWAGKRGEPVLPANRAAKRLGCAIGAVFLGGAAIAYQAGASGVGLALASVLGATAAFVALTGVCVPSILFTAVWGGQRACAPALVALPRRSANPASASTPGPAT